MRYTVNLEIDLADIPFIKKAIQDRTDDLLDYIDTLTQMKVEEIVEEMEEEKEEEIRDIEIDQFQAELRDMIAKHTPPKKGRPKGSKNKVKTNAK
jgi:dsDNA-binding SOS-regulon protein